MLIDTVIFDLDGTLLDTLEDLKDSTNFALRSFGMPERSLEEMRNFVGRGVNTQIHRAVPDGTDEETEKKVLEAFKEHYLKNGKNKTKLYDGIIEFLDELNAMGMKLAIVSNKIDESIKGLNRYYMGNRIPVAVGGRDDLPKKPARDLADIALDKLGKDTSSAVFVGDSDVDIDTAENLGIPCISVTWGFRTREELLAANAKYLADTPQDVIRFIKELGENK